MIILKVKAPRVMKKIPLKVIEQDFRGEFPWWHYDECIEEAVNVLGKGAEKKFIRDVAN